MAVDRDEWTRDVGAEVEGVNERVSSSMDVGRAPGMAARVARSAAEQKAPVLSLGRNCDPRRDAGRRNAAGCRGRCAPSDGPTRRHWPGQGIRREVGTACMVPRVCEMEVEIDADDDVEGSLSGTKVGVYIGKYHHHRLSVFESGSTRMISSSLELRHKKKKKKKSL